MALTLDDYINYGIAPDDITDEYIWSLRDFLAANGAQTDAVSVHTLCTDENYVTVDSVVKHIICVIDMSNKRSYYSYKFYKWMKLEDKLDEFVVARHGMTAAEVNAIRPQAWEQILEGSKSLQVNTYFSNPLSSQLNSTELVISRMDLIFKDEVITQPALGTTQTFQTSMWKRINKISVQETLTENSKIRYTVYSDKLGRSSVWSDRMKRWTAAPVSDIDILESGMSSKDFDNLPQEALDELLGKTLTFNAVIHAELPDSYCQFCSVTVDHDKYDNILKSNPVHTQSGSKSYTQYSWDTDIDCYVYEMVEGVGFENAKEEDDFYTTPNKIILKAMPLGTLIGTRRSIVYRCELSNTYKNRYLHVKLTMSYGGFAAVDMEDGTCRLRDSSDLRFATEGEISFNGPSDDDFAHEYPLEFDVPPSSDTLFYFRVTPTLATVGEVNAQIVAVTSEISREEYLNGRHKDY